MRICLITGPCRHGSCGITDYVDLLGKKLNSLGHEIIHHSVDSPKGFSSLAEKLPEAEVFSIQFAPYLYSKSGLSGDSLFKLAKKLSIKKSHINFHEIWVGSYPQASFKERLIGWMQRYEIIKFLKTVDPNLITTTNSAALDRLKRRGVEAKYLYLFGNIPFLSTQYSCDSKNIKVVLFGTIYSEFPFDKLANSLNSISSLGQKRIELRIIGKQRENTGLEQLKELAIENRYLISEIGRLSVEKISFEFQNCHLGVSTSPFDVHGKSGATAAMLEHGLPILVYDDGDTSKECLFAFPKFSDQFFLINDPDHMTNLYHFMEKPRKPFFDGVHHTALKMLDHINES